MEGMTRAQHYQRAQELLAEVEGFTGPVVQVHATLAQVHATLALAMPDVAGETQELVMELGPVLERPDPDVMVDRLLRALAELERDSAKWAARFIQERVLGGERTKPDPEGYVAVAELKAALEELAAQDSVESTRSCASFVWSRIFGEVMP